MSVELDITDYLIENGGDPFKSIDFIVLRILLETKAGTRVRTGRMRDGWTMTKDGQGGYTIENPVPYTYVWEQVDGMLARAVERAQADFGG